MRYAWLVKREDEYFIWRSEGATPLAVHMELVERKIVSIDERIRLYFLAKE